ncbi:hypothetical protein Sango_0011900 [Sesamum angolense]|uniref:GAG-pre-integrase domain-containing protein n=1 Tax=Sesamum angolense TaxID=2727404 RepID=A0AAE1XCS7_9LAMI|nr:hypothetical protein Sango_0011900 [Sesamum angolense]
MLGVASTSKKARRWKKKENKAKRSNPYEQTYCQGPIVVKEKNKEVSKVIARSTRLSKSEVDLQLENSKRVTAEAEGLVHLVIWHVRLDHISQDTIRKLVELNSLELDDLDNLTFNTQVRGGFTYFITFITDHSQCGYVYLMKYKFEAKFKEFRPEVENQIGRKTKVLRLDSLSEF